MSRFEECCDVFSQIKNKFNWFSYEDDDDSKVFCMPSINSIRVNHCPSCGENIRSIELKEN